MNCSSGTRFQTSIIGQMYFEINKTKQCFTSFLFGLGVENNHGIGSKTLLTEISKLGYAISCDEVKRYKQSVSMDEDHKLDHIKDAFTHFVVDNVDYNIDTLDGKGTFHGMYITDFSVLNKYLPGKRVTQIIKILKKEKIERKVTHK